MPQIAREFSKARDIIFLHYNVDMGGGMNVDEVLLNPSDDLFEKAVEQARKSAKMCSIMGQTMVIGFLIERQISGEYEGIRFESDIVKVGVCYFGQLYVDSEGKTFVDSNAGCREPLKPGNRIYNLDTGLMTYEAK